MGNCLVTKLKSAVDNDNLKKLGIARMVILTNGSMTVDNKFVKISAASTGPVEVKCPDGAYMTVGGIAKDSITIDAGSSASITLSDIGENGKYTLEITKYNLTEVIGGNLYINNVLAKRLLMEDLEYANNFTSSAFLYGNLSELPYLPALTTIGIADIAIFEGDFAVFAEKYKNSTSFTTLQFNGSYVLTNLTTSNIKKIANISTLRISHTNAAGDIKELGNLPLTSLTLNNNSSIYGSIEELVARRRGHGATTGSITIPTIGGVITFNGVQLTTVLSDKTLEWTASEITFNGTTVQNSDVDSNY